MNTDKMAVSNETVLCPNCGKVMGQEPAWPGLWSCPDYKVRLNDSPPFQFKCTGMILTDAGAALFDMELHKVYVERN